MSKIDLVDNRFGRLVVKSKLELRNKQGAVIWECVCDCGSVRFIPTGQLKSGKSLSCSCLTKEINSKRTRTHGMSKSKEFKIWAGIRNRCYNKNEPSYLNYGGRGIHMSDEWFNSFETFYQDMGPRPSKNHSIERENNNGPYCKSNCKWATRVEQANNRRTNVFYEYNGIARTLTGWARELGLNKNTLAKRLNLGWAFEKAISEPIHVESRNNVYSREK